MADIITFEQTGYNIGNDGYVTITGRILINGVPTEKIHSAKAGDNLNVIDFQAAIDAELGHSILAEDIKNADIAEKDSVYGTLDFTKLNETLNK